MNHRMNKQDLLKEVIKSAPPGKYEPIILENAVESYSIAVGKEDFLNCEQPVPAVIRIAFLMKGAIKKEEEEGKKEDEEKKEKNILNIPDKAESSFLLHKIKPWAESVRLEIFGCKEAPFTKKSVEEGIDASVNWIRKEDAEIIPSDIQKKIKRFKNEISKIRALMDEGEALGNLGIRANLLAFPGEDLYVSRISSAGHEKLEVLYDAVSRMKAATGFQDYELTMYILAGINPVFRRASIKTTSTVFHLPTGGTLPRSFFTIEIGVRDLSFEELRSIHNEYRRSANSVKKRRISTRNTNLLAIVARKEQSSTHNKNTGSWTKYWKSVADEWVGDSKKHHHAYITHERLLKRMEDDHMDRL